MLWFVIIAFIVLAIIGLYVGVKANNSEDAGTGIFIFIIFMILAFIILFDSLIS